MIVAFLTSVAQPLSTVRLSQFHCLSNSSTWRPQLRRHRRSRFCYELPTVPQSATNIAMAHSKNSISGYENDNSPRHSTLTSIARRHFILNSVPAFFSFTLYSLLGVSSSSTASFGESVSSSAEEFVKLPCSGTGCRSVEIKDFRVGSGREVSDGSTLVLKWTGRLADRYGWPFQRDSDEDVTIVFGKDRLIPGFVQGLQGMREGGKRRLLIPGELGYSDEVSGPLPNDFGDRRRLFATVLNRRRFKNAGDLVIDVQLKKVRPGPTGR